MSRKYAVAIVSPKHNLKNFPPLPKIHSEWHINTLKSLTEFRTMPASLQVLASRSLLTLQAAQQVKQRDFQQVCSSVFWTMTALLWVSTSIYWCSLMYLAPSARSLSVVAKLPNPGALRDQDVSALRIVVLAGELFRSNASWRTVRKGNVRRYGCKAYQIGLVITSRQKETNWFLKYLPLIYAGCHIQD